MYGYLTFLLKLYFKAFFVLFRSYPTGRHHLVMVHCTTSKAGAETSTEGDLIKRKIKIKKMLSKLSLFYLL